MSSRDVILQRIRTQTQKISPLRPPPAVEIWPPSDPSKEEMIERFAEELQAVQGELVRCSTLAQACQELAKLAEQSSWEKIGAADRPQLRELASAMPPERIQWAADGWKPQQMAKLSAGLIAAECLLADTGSCVVANHTAEERLLCYLPPVCLVLARSKDLFPHLPAAWPQISNAMAQPQSRGEHVLITGPSRTADIEKILILGVHGPERLIVLLLD